MAIFNMTGVNEAQIGDLKDSIGTLSSKWLACNGAGVNSADYPALVPLLQTANPTGYTVTLPRANYGSNLLMNAQGAYYYNGRWVVVCNGYNSSTSVTPYKPVAYSATDLYGEWSEVLLAASGYFMVGVTYEARWGDWVAFGYKYVSSTECYPYIFYASDPAGTWTGYQVSNTCCKIAGGCYADGKLVLVGKGCASENSAYAYAYVCSGYSISFTEYNYSTAHSQGIRGLTYGNGYWAYADNSGGLYYATDPAGAWTRKVIVSSGVQFRGLAYGNGTWSICGTQNSGGSGRAYYATDITGTWTSNGVTDVNNNNDQVFYSGGVWVMVANRMGGSSYYFVSTDDAHTWTRKTFSHGTPYCLYASGGQFVLCTLYGVNVFRRPEYDAPLPILTPRLGTTYIKAL